ncbi:DNA polymerase V [Cyphellophora attinorum]|uniref:DNA polymerase V n=1 Tax=Cyphellophora attinorum TaxID=1664694 RepID=A0A0N1HET1_9EURO|nr:DNA polymerase V [Phialophora attinorum]KPI44034.1 DNA polymerase V [Phialophora attinorum]
MSKKRKRDGTEVDVDLVSIYNNLAHEHESVRLKAAQQLLSKAFSDASTEDQVRAILRRLFRGLSSSRKAARLGFAVALTECLSQLKVSNLETSFRPSEVVDIFEAATEPEGGARGQEERDYYFGRVFGAGAIIQSGILFVAEDRSLWKKLLVLLCGIALKKPWLRQECGWTLFQFCASVPADTATLQPFIEDVIAVLNEHKLIRTPEGVAIWLAAKQSLPHANLSKHVWKHSHPLASKDVKNLAEVMKNARTQQLDDEHGAQGSTSWSASLHFAWAVVLGSLYQKHEQGHPNGVSTASTSHDLISFAEFWKAAVDEGLLAAGSSNERKLWGILLVAQAASTAPAALLCDTLSPNALHVLMLAFTSEGRYLHKIAQGALQQLEKRIKAERWHSAANAPGDCLAAILEATDYADFDQATKSKICPTLLDKGDQRHSLSQLRRLQTALRAHTDPATIRKSKHLITLEYKLLAACIRKLDSDQGDDAKSMVAEILGHGLHRIDDEPEQLRQHVRDRNAAAFEQLVKAGSSGQSLFSRVLSIQDLLADLSDPAIRQVLETAAKRVRKLEKAEKKHAQQQENAKAKSRNSSLSDGYKLLYSLVAFDIYNGEQESIEIMQDLLEVVLPDMKSENPSTDPLIEILLSFSSRPSRFLRTLTPIIFESIASGISSSGIASLTRVLASKENSQGQQEIFEAADDAESAMDVDGSEEEGSGDSDDEEAEELDSDVELVNADHRSEEHSSDERSSSGSSSGAEDDGEEDDELAAFDAALAAALGPAKANGTANGNEEDPGSDSDSDMDDDQMMALDEKLSEVFRARNLSSKPDKKKAARDAKDTIVNFKNRVLDLMDVYVKHQHLSPAAVGLILPLLVSIRTTQTKQIAERSAKILKDLCTRCKGQNVPVLQLSELDESGSSALKLLQDVHDEACLEASNIHSSAASQASILLSKVLIRSGIGIARVTAVYAATTTRMLTDAKCKVQPSFFTDWNNWCVSARVWTTKLLA